MRRCRACPVFAAAAAAAENRQHACPVSRIAQRSPGPFRIAHTALPPLLPPLLQVCAPSNSALDEIVLRLITLGLTDQDGRVFTPNVVSRYSRPM